MVTLTLLQPQNLVMMGSFPDCNVKLCDFEISRVVLEGTEVREILGTPDYVGKSSLCTITRIYVRFEFVELSRVCVLTGGHRASAESATTPAHLRCKVIRPRQYVSRGDGTRGEEKIALDRSSGRDKEMCVRMRMQPRSLFIHTRANL